MILEYFRCVSDMLWCPSCYINTRHSLHAVCFLQDCGKVVRRALRHQHRISDHWLICEELHSQRLARVVSGGAFGWSGDAMWVVVGTSTQYIPTGQLAQGCIMHRTYIFVLLARHAGLNPREAKIWSWLRLKLEFCPQCESAYWCSDRRYWPRDHQDMWQLWSLNHFEPKPLFQTRSTRCRCGVIYCANARGNFCCAKRASAVCCGPGLGCNWVSSPSGVTDHCPKSGRFRTSPWI